MGALNTTGGVDEVFGQKGGRRGASVKTLKRMLKKAGLKTTGKKAALTRRVKKAHLKMRGGDTVCKENEQIAADGVTCEPIPPPPAASGGRRRRRGTRSRKH